MYLSAMTLPDDTADALVASEGLSETVEGYRALLDESVADTEETSPLKNRQPFNILKSVTLFNSLVMIFLHFIIRRKISP